MVLDMLLTVEGYDVELVTDGLEALAYLKENTPDLAILAQRYNTTLAPPSRSSTCACPTSTASRSAPA